ncbi:uncharacterized protein LOC143280062 isoform X1 [Babylonia areolata]|uniref:uncharacterized protein LOC143280062 isoform X1 n=1 Tax=Babylonia areolata TaxID=304850 RepID=UPI003FCF61A2
MPRPVFIERTAKTSSFDRDSKNKWRWEWVDKTVEDQRVGEVIRKIEKDGYAYCTVCDSEIKYSSRGFVTIREHLTRPTHQEIFAACRNASRLPGMVPEPPVKPYGIHPSVRSDVKPTTVDSTPLIHTEDRKSNLEALTLAFAAENNLSLSFIPKLIEFTKTLAADKKALAGLKMGRACASYKMRKGLGKVLQKRLVRELQQCPFSLNLDEAMSKTHQKVLTVLVSHFSPTEKLFVTHHLVSVTLVKVSADFIFKELDAVFTDLKLPWENLVSILMDSCAVMRGSKAGLETLIRQKKAPHLLDIDGDSCHLVHNAAKQFCSKFEGHVETLLSNLHTDFLWSPEQRELLADVCQVLGIKPTTPQQYIPHRWLTVLDVAADTLRLMDGLTVYYFSFLSSSDQTLYAEIFEDVLGRIRCSVSDTGKKTVRQIQSTLAKKFRTFTKDGKERKEKIINKLFYKRSETLLILQFYISVLPPLNSYVKLFQAQEPMTHMLHKKQEELLKRILEKIVKPEAFFVEEQKTTSRCISETQQLRRPAELKTILVTENAMPVSSISIGVATRALCQTTSPAIRKEFLQKAAASLITLAQYLQQKLPLDNKVLQTCKALDPSVRTLSATGNALCHLPDFLPSQVQCDDFITEVRAYNSDTDLPLQTSDPVTKWWIDLEDKCPLLSKAARTLLTCFHSALVEANFSTMGDLLDSHCSRTSMELYSAYQSVKCYMATRKVSAVEMFGRDDPISQAPDKDVVLAMRAARSEDKADLQDKKAAAEEKREMLGAPATPSQMETKVSVKSQLTSKDSKNKDSRCKDSSEKLQQKQKRPQSQFKDSCSTGQEEKNPSAAEDRNEDQKVFFQNLNKHLTDASSSFWDFKSLAVRVEKKMLEQYPVPFSSQKLKHYLADQESEELLPDDAPGLMPIQIYGDGNCLPRCASLLATGVQEHHFQMRLRIAVELAAHEDFYLTEENLRSTASPADYLKTYALFSDQYTSTELTSEAVCSTFRKEVLHILTPGTYMGIWQLHAVASVLQRPIFSIYPSYGGHNVRQYLHRIISPRVSSYSKESDLPGIMWTRTDGKSLPESAWTPNHFVVCLSGSKSRNSAQPGPDSPKSIAKDSACNSSQASDRKRKASADIRAFFSKKSC